MADISNYNLIGTKFKPDRHEWYKMAGLEGRAYNNLDPYPWFALQSWRTEERGPLPRCLPIPQSIAKQSANWLFGKDIEIEHPNIEAKNFLQAAWAANKMGSKMVAAATKGSYEGGIVLKFSLDPAGLPIYQILSPVDQAKVYYDPLDISRVLMVRVQYPFFNPTDGKYYWYREEWTETELVKYDPLPISGFGISIRNPYLYTGNPVDADLADGWKVKSKEKNPFAPIIPFRYVKNLETMYQFGLGDLWTMYRVMDRINIVYHLMDRSNQLDGDPVKVFIDLEAEQDDIDRSLEPGASLSLKSAIDAETGVPKEGRVQILEAQGNMRAPMELYAKDMRQMLYESTGAVFLRPEDITNKGNLTVAVQKQLYGPLIDLTLAKRKTYGAEGLCLFFDDVLKATKKIKGQQDVGTSILWAPFFDPSEDEKFRAVDRITREIDNGLITRENAIRKVSLMEEIEDVEEQVTELKDFKPEPTVVEENTDVSKHRQQTRGKTVRDTN